MATSKTLEKYLNLFNHVLIIANGIFIVNLSWKEQFRGTSWHVLLVTIGVGRIITLITLYKYTESLIKQFTALSLTVSVYIGRSSHVTLFAKLLHKITSKT